MKKNKTLTRVILICITLFICCTFAYMGYTSSREKAAARTIQNMYPGQRAEFVDILKRDGRSYYEIRTIDQFGEEGETHYCIDTTTGKIYDYSIDGTFTPHTQ